MARKRYLVLGDGAAGMTAAQALRQADRSAAITIVSDDPNPAYFRAALTNYLLGELREEQVWAVPPGFYTELGLERMLDRVTSVDSGRSQVWLASGGAPLVYDALFVGTGSRARPPAFEGAELPGVATLRTLQDVRWVMDLVSLQGLRRAVVVGGGPLALEWAHALKERGVEVAMLVRETRFLVGALDGVASDLLLARMRGAGIEVRLGEEIRAAVPGRDGRLASVATRSGLTVPCELCAVAIGVLCNTEFLKGSGVELGKRGGIVVDRRMRTSAPNVLAAGDCAELEGKLDQKWEPARRQAQVAAINMTGGERTYAPGTEYFATRLYDLDFASLGRIEGGPAGEGFQELVDHKKSTGRISYKKLVIQRGKLLGALMLGEREEHVRSRGKLFKRLIDEQLDVGAIQAELLDPAFDLQGWLATRALTEKPKPSRSIAIPAGVQPPSAVPANAVLRGTRAIDVAKLKQLALAAQASGPPLPAPPPAMPAPGARSPGAMLSIGLRIPVAPVQAASAGAPAWVEGAGRRWDLGAGVTSIGREASSAIVLTDPTVSHLHAQITPHDAGLFLRDLGSKSGTWANDGRVTIPHLLRDGDRIRVGRTELVFRTSAPAPAPPRAAPSPAPAAAAEPPPAPAPAASGPAALCVEVMTGQVAGLVFALSGPSLTIGRDPGCALRLDDLSISRRHALLSEFNGQWHVSDLHSSRGTWKNAERLPPGQDVPFQEGDRLQLGDAILVVKRRPA